MDRVVRAWPIAVSAAMFLLSLPGTNAVLGIPHIQFGLLVFAAFAPWLVSLKTATGKGAFKSGYLFGVIVVLAQMSFLLPLVNRWTGSIWLALVPWLLCGIIGAFYFAFLAWLVRGCFLRGWYWAIPVVWAGVEVCRSFIPGLAFPWFLAGTPLWAFPLVNQLAFVGTVYLVSAWVILANLLLVMFLEKAPLTLARNYMLAFALLLGMSVVIYATPQESKLEPVMLGQLGVDMAFNESARGVEYEIAAAAIELIDKSLLTGTKLLIMPEGMVQGGASLPPNTHFPIPQDAKLMFGGKRFDVEDEKGRSFQTAYAYDGEWKYADKMRLVVFGEYVPGRDYIPFLTSFKLPSGDLKPSEKVSAITVSNIRVGPLICFEGMFWDIAHRQSENGAQMLVQMSLDDWYMGTVAPQQLMAGSVFRSVETGLPMARVGSLGYSVATDYRGRLLAMAPLGKQEGMRVEIPVPVNPMQNPARPLFVWLFGLSLPAFVVAFWRWKEVHGPMQNPTQTP